MSGVVGPGRELSAAEVPTLLVHGSYAEHTNSIHRYGLQARRAIHLLEDRVKTWPVARRPRNRRFCESASAGGQIWRHKGIAAPLWSKFCPGALGRCRACPLLGWRLWRQPGNVRPPGTKRAGAPETGHQPEPVPLPGYGVPGQEASAPAVDVGPFPTLSATEEVGGPSVGAFRARRRVYGHLGGRGSASCPSHKRSCPTSFEL